MATATKTRRKGKAVDLREEMDLAELLPPGVNQQSVDRANSIIRGVKVLSKFSPNKHGMHGVDGTSYELSAHEQLRDLLESGEIMANMGHPPKGAPDLERVPEDRNGVFLNPRIVNGETYADWHLIPSHRMTPSLLDCAEKKELNGQFALSINARGYGDVRNGRYCITEFLPTPSNPDTFIRGVDCVTRGGACRTLFESSEAPMKKIKFKELVVKAGKQDWWKACEKRAKAADVLEMYEDMGDMAVEEPAEEEMHEEMHWKEHLGNLLKAIVNDPEMSPEEIHEKVSAALKCLKEEGEEEAKEGEEIEKEVDEEKETEEEEKDAMEARQLRKELEALKDKEGVRDLAESLEYQGITSAEIATVAKLKSVVDRVKKINEFKKAKVKKPGAHTASARTVMESQQLPSYDNDSKEARQKRIAALK